MTTNMSQFDSAIEQELSLVVAQRKELVELLGFETRNKYEICLRSGQPIGFAAEQQKGIIGFLLRQFFGHWRSFEIAFFDVMRNPILVANHPFRWFFQCLTVVTAQGQLLGKIERRWAWFSKRFDVVDAQNALLLTVQSPLWRPWTFSFERNGVVVAVVKKRWSGALKEMFTDADNFAVDFEPGPVSPLERRLLLAAAVFIDLMYFEQKAD